jgi:transposase
VRIFARAGIAPGTRRKAEPDWPAIHRELRRRGVTLMLLWREYRTQQPKAYGYSRFCELYRDWESRLSPTMRQVHPAGERLFVNYAGQTVDVIDGATGEVRAAQIFVAVLGASSYTYAEATATQTLPDWIGAHVRALNFIGGVARQIVPDNPKVGVVNANWYEPGLNPTYQDFATHYGVRPSCRLYGLKGDVPEAARLCRVDLDDSSVEHNLAYYQTLRDLSPEARSQAILSARPGQVRLAPGATTPMARR